MGTTRIKVIDLSSDQKEIKTSRKHAEKLAGLAKVKKEEKLATKKPQEQKLKPLEPVETQPEELDPQVSQETPDTTEEVPAAEDTQQEKTIVQKAAPAQKKHNRHKGKKYLAAKKLIEDKTYSVKEALALLPKTSPTKFDPAVEVHLNVVDKSVKASVSFPHAAGGKQKEKKYLVFSDKKSSGDQKNIIWANEATITDIESGKLKPGRDFDVVISSPKFMPHLAKVAKVLGPRGMMPNPKAQTVTEDIEKFFKGQDQNSTEFRTDPNAPVIHAKIGKLSQGEKQIEENLKALILAIGSSKVRKATLTSTMSPGIRFDAATA